MKTAAFAAVIAVFCTTVTAETWKIDPDHTEVRAYWDHAGFSEQSLEFTEVDGSLQFSLDSVSESHAFFTIPVKSMATGVERFNHDLWSSTFFDVETYPTISFNSTSFRQVGPMKVQVTGDLTIKDVTKEATFDVIVHNVGEHPVGRFFSQFQGNWLGVTAVTTIRRSEWGMGAFVPIGSDEIRIEINSELREEVPE
ncbi:YceI family protein [Sedimentitalea nanhaiensis]|uniref:Polyisoprenoid-binding protein YceI n=1 Tax=Sedimentitalea nanhaiensis TaxID=999627 RepID=A0A1I6Y1I7_9RHOB|nr:YceI family protein [Sedimentitalea nanhaiensis]SFT44420.1 Polyisoprenoid-binding protein YceI [Sedimentitalea nanhaiensis]